jgi:uncharacterized protein DUF5694
VRLSAREHFAEGDLSMRMSDAASSVAIKMVGLLGVLIVCLNLTLTPIQAQELKTNDQKRATIMILGTYHMDNPRLDDKNLEADDVLSPRRQREIAELVEKLARFNPTKIAIEAPYHDTYWSTRYTKYLKGEYKLGRNEIEQIGFQLAKRLNHTTLYPVDYPMLMSGLRYDEIEAPKPKPTPPNAPGANTPNGIAPPALSEEDKLLRNSTVTEFLLYLNEEERVRKDHGNYLLQLLPNDNPAIYESADRVTNWYKRNLRMFANINRITDFPNDRILLIVGSGHLKILRDFALDAPQFQFVDVKTYLK